MTQERLTFLLLRLPLSASAALIPPLASASQLAPLIQLMISCLFYHLSISFHGHLVFLLVLKIINLVVVDTAIVDTIISVPLYYSFSFFFLSLLSTF